MLSNVASPSKKERFGCAVMIKGLYIVFILDSYITLSLLYHVASILDLLSFLLGFHPLCMCPAYILGPRLHPRYAASLLSSCALSQNRLRRSVLKKLSALVIKHGGLGSIAICITQLLHIIGSCFLNILHRMHMHEIYSTHTQRKIYIYIHTHIHVCVNGPPLKLARESIQEPCSFLEMPPSPEGFASNPSYRA